MQGRRRCCPTESPSGGPMNRAKCFAAVLLAAACTISPTVNASSAGLAGYTAKNNAGGCGGCHAANGNVTSVIITGAAALDPGVTSAYTVTINTAVSSVNAGIDVSASDGTL